MHPNTCIFLLKHKHYVFIHGIRTRKHTLAYRYTQIHTLSHLNSGDTHTHLYIYSYSSNHTCIRILSATYPHTYPYSFVWTHTLNPKGRHSTALRILPFHLTFFLKLFSIFHFFFFLFMLFSSNKMESVCKRKGESE